jgi:SAM-dependent methyltransferase
MPDDPLETQGRAETRLDPRRVIRDAAAPAGHVRWQEAPPPAALLQAPLDELAAAITRRIAQGPGFDGNTYLGWVGSRLHHALRTHLDIHNNPFSRKKLADLFWNLCVHLAHRPVLAGRTVVDIGPGANNPFGFAFVLLLLGSRRVFTVECDQIPELDRACRALPDIFAMLMTDPARIVHDYPVTRQDVLRNFESMSFDLAKLREGDPQGLDPDRLELRRDAIEHLSLADGEADLVISNAVFEHLADVDVAVAELARVTKPRGLGVHLVDTSDHARYGDGSVHPLHFLRMQTRERMVNGSNRLRLFQIAEAFARHGFEVLQVRRDFTVAVTRELRSGFVEPFRSMPLSQLEVLTGVVLVRRR